MMLVGMSVKAQTSNYDFEDNGLYYKIDSTGEGLAVVKGDNLYKGSVIIPETVTHESKTYNVTTIASEAFSDCNELTSIDFGNVTTLEDKAFNNCVGLKSLNLKNVKTLNLNTFVGCISLESLDLGKVESLPDGDESICHGVFSDLEHLTTVDLGEVKTIGNFAFRNCINLTNVDFSNVETIGKWSFNRCTSIKSVKPEKVMTIKEYAFSYCEGLVSIELIDVKNIKKGTFNCCYALEKVNLGNAKNVAIYAFDGCENIKEVRTYETEPPVLSGYSFVESAYSAILYVPVSCKDAYANHKSWGKFTNIVEADPSGINDIINKDLIVNVYNGTIVIEGSNCGDNVKVYTHDGTLVSSMVSDGNVLNINVKSNAIYIVKVGERIFKLAL